MLTDLQRRALIEAIRWARDDETTRQLRSILCASAAPAEGREAMTEEAVERQYRDGIHIGSGFPRAICPCGLCIKHRFGFNRATAPTMGEAARPEPGTTEYGSWILEALNDANSKLYFHKDRFRWACCFEQALQRYARERIDRAAAKGESDDC